MASKRRTSLLVDNTLLQKARKALRVTTNSEAITRALEEVVANKEVEASLQELIRKGRGRFVDVYQEPQ
ncbi:MAG TPA: type II toxin-antitoxin system VapB family antitoxin [Candidatus Binatia bacterium]|jgi:Arc/MetJ family transcription regulator|nr:type II toxin-antitoxin system VapB family antitoxin [Candidatus Binatia bacterium]